MRVERVYWCNLWGSNSRENGRNMLHSSTQKLLLKLHEMTLDGAIAWKEAENDAVKLETEGYCVLISPDPIGMELNTVKGRLLEKADETILAATPIDENRSFIDVISEIAQEGARYARGTEQAINAILGAAETGVLSEGLDFPFRDAGEETGGGLDTPETAAMAAAVGDLAARLNSEEAQQQSEAVVGESLSEAPAATEAPVAETPLEEKPFDTTDVAETEEIEAVAQTTPDVAETQAEAEVSEPQAENGPEQSEVLAETPAQADQQPEDVAAVPEASSLGETPEIVAEPQNGATVAQEVLVDEAHGQADQVVATSVPPTEPPAEPIASETVAEEITAEVTSVSETQPEATADVVATAIADEGVDTSGVSDEALPPPPHDFLLSAEAAAASRHPTIETPEEAAEENDEATAAEPEAESTPDSTPAAPVEESNTPPAPPMMPQGNVPTPPTMPVRSADPKTPSPVGFQQPVFEPKKESKPAASEGLRKVTALGFALGRHSGSTVSGIPTDIEQRANDHSKNANGDAATNGANGSNGAYKPWG